MLLKVALASFSCMVVFGCTSKTNQEESQKLIYAESTSNIPLSTNKEITRKRQQWQEFLQSQDASRKSSLPMPIELQPNRKAKLEPPSLRNDIKVPQTSSLEPVKLNSYMSLTPTQTTNVLGNPIYKLNLVE